MLSSDDLKDLHPVSNSRSSPLEQFAYILQPPSDEQEQQESNSFGEKKPVLPCNPNHSLMDASVDQHKGFGKIK